MLGWPSGLGLGPTNHTTQVAAGSNPVDILCIFFQFSQTLRAKNMPSRTFSQKITILGFKSTKNFSTLS